jgi:NADP-dependent 3-hydroxy acid dehydrogenase YdfG
MNPVPGFNGDLNGTVGLITGGLSGIGAAVATELSDRGATIVAVDVAIEPAEGAPVSPGVHSVRADVRNFADMTAVAVKVLADFGRLDFVVANAGITDWGSMSTGDPDRWHEVIDTNVLGVAHTIRAVLPVLVAQGSGHVVITSSISGRVTYVGEPIYIATKWALVGLGGSLRKEVASAGVRVSLIEPGVVDTPLVRNSAEGAAELASVRALDAADVARAVRFVLEQPAHVNIDELLISPVGHAVY